MSKFKLLSFFIGTIVVCCLEAQTVATLAGSLSITGSIDGPRESALFNNPHGIALDTMGNIYVADRYNHLIRKISSAGMVSTLAGIAGVSGDTDGLATEATFYEPWGLCIANNGDVLVADTRNNKIRRIKSDGTVITIAGNGAYGGADGFAATFGNPTGIEQAENGTIYIADHKTHIIRAISPAGEVRTLAGSLGLPGDTDGQGTLAQFYRPYGLTLDLEGNIIVADEWNHKIRKITPQGLVTTIAGTGEIGMDNGYGDTATFNYPWDVTVDKDGTIYVGDGYNYVVRKINLNTWVSTYAGTPQERGGENGAAANATFEGPTALVIDTSNQYIYISDTYNDLIRVIYPGAATPALNLDHFSGSDTICTGDVLSLSILAPPLSNCQLTINDVTEAINDPQLIEWTATTAGIYQFSAAAVLDNGDQILSDTLQLMVEALPETSISSVDDFEVQDGIAIELQASGASSYLWSTGETSSSIFVLQAGMYSVQAMNAYCIGEIVTVEVSAGINDGGGLPPSEQIRAYLPSAFSPNGDGNNDIFRIRGMREGIPLVLSIYDHWGNLVFQTRELSAGWDGTIRQQAAATGVYTYVLSYPNEQQLWQQVNGQLLLHY